MKRLIWSVSIVWLSLVVASFLLNYFSARKNNEHLLLMNARSFFEHIVFTRAWNAEHGGVYVPVKKGTTEPNPYLDSPNRDIPISDDLTLTMINPAYMTRQISEIVSRHKGVKFHITSLKPIRPLNKPDKREEEALLSFENGKKEFYQTVINKEKDPFFFYMAPLSTTKACLSCHAKQGYVVGDIRGGISVTIPFQREGHFFHLFILFSLLGVAGFLGIAFFTRKLRKAYSVISKQAVIDGLTQIPNRRSFDANIAIEFRRGVRAHMPLSLIICDIDFFKKYNDSYGHLAGDQCLKIVAQTIQKEIKRPSDFCARYGGEEFVILLPNTDQQGASIIAENVRQSIEGLKISDMPKITISLGVATSEFNTPEMTPDKLVKNADLALYRAKEEGRNRVEVY